MQLTVTAVLGSTGNLSLIPIHTLQWPRGSDGTLQILVVDETGAPVNLTGRSMVIGVRQNDSDPTPIFIRACTLTSPTTGIAQAAIAAADTDGLSKGPYRWDCWLTDTNGRHQIVAASTFLVVESETRIADGPSPYTPISPLINGAVDTVNSTGQTLVSVDASLMTDGYLLWCRQFKCFFHIEVGNAYPVDNVNVATALNLSGGQWVRGIGSS
jgi:hypothetical protein